MVAGVLLRGCTEDEPPARRAAAPDSSRLNLYETLLWTAGVQLQGLFRQPAGVHRLQRRPSAGIGAGRGQGEICSLGSFCFPSQEGELDKEE